MSSISLYKRVSSGNRGLIGLHWTDINIDLRKSDFICWHFASKTSRKGGRLQNAVQTFSDSLLFSSFSLFVLQVISRSTTCFADSLRRFRMEWCWVSWRRSGLCLLRYMWGWYRGTAMFIMLYTMQSKVHQFLTRGKNVLLFSDSTVLFINIIFTLKKNKNT